MEGCGILKDGTRWFLVKRAPPTLGCLPWYCLALSECEAFECLLFLSPTTFFYIHSSNETLTPRLAMSGRLSYPSFVLPATLRTYRDALMHPAHQVPQEMLC